MMDEERNAYVNNIMTKRNKSGWKLLLIMYAVKSHEMKICNILCCF
jgi:hypothetical protein